MDELRDDFLVAQDNWDRVQEIRKIELQLASMQLWYNADTNPDKEVLQDVQKTLAALGDLRLALLELQIKLLTRL